MNHLRQELFSRIDLALRIASRALRYLGPNGFNGAASPEGNFAAEKPLAETAMLLYVAARATCDPAVHRRFEGLVQNLIPYARSRQLAWDALCYPAIALQLCTPHILLQALGHHDSGFNDILVSADAARASRGHEVVPYRELELIWLRSLWLNQPPGGELEQTASRTALGNAIDLLHGTRDDAYAHTHGIMYYTDFGNWRRSLPRPAGEFLAESAAILARALIVEDYDLAAEALMAWPLTSSDWSPAAAFAFKVLTSLEDKVGFLPAGPINSMRSPQLVGEERTRHAVASSYHTAYVMGMLCALSLNPEISSPSRLTGSRYPLQLIETLQSFIAKKGAHWEQVFYDLTAEEQAPLAPFLLDVALIQSSHKGELARMVELLEIAMQNGMANTTLCAQSAEFLSRIAALRQPEATQSQAKIGRAELTQPR